MFPEKKNQEGTLAERGDGSLCSEDSRSLGSEWRECQYTRTNDSTIRRFRLTTSSG
jgi:hypothetical protein